MTGPPRWYPWLERLNRRYYSMPRTARALCYAPGFAIFFMPTWWLVLVAVLPGMAAIVGITYLFSEPPR